MKRKRTERKKDDSPVSPSCPDISTKSAAGYRERSREVL